jgi:hypothetical protein
LGHRLSQRIIIYFLGFFFEIYFDNIDIAHK